MLSKFEPFRALFWGGRFWPEGPFFWTPTPPPRNGSNLLNILSSTISLQRIDLAHLSTKVDK